MSTFVVSGVRRYSDAVLQTTTLQFDTNSTLLMAPSDKGGPASTTLTIIADSIVIADHAVITYDLDNGPGIDPTTPAQSAMGTGANGFNGSSIPGVGMFPQASNGGDAGPGLPGPKGNSGINAPELEIFVGKVQQNFADAITVNFKGQDGGGGGNGGSGGMGGAGQKGSASTTSDSWYDGDQCDQEPGKGGNGGKGGDAGYPGRGGGGGNGGIISVFALKPSLPSVQTWNYIVKGGKGASPGSPGNPGGGGAGGPQGDQNDPCPARPEYAGSDGPPGQTTAQIDPNWTTDYAGPDGEDGYSGTYELTGMPS